MKSASNALLILAAALAGHVAACGDDHSHGHDHSKRSQPGSTQPGPHVRPAAPLVWGDINFIHTTDSHGWLLGHTWASYPEPNYSADFGDFASFVHHMKQQAKERDVDLLLIDSGDLHDGTGLSDNYPAGSVDAHETNKFFFDLPYDVLAIGNHELYEYNVAYDMHANFAPRWGDKYLSSNVNITVADSKTGALKSVPVGQRFRKFKTMKGKKVTALGVLYNFAGNSANTTVQYAKDMVHEAWFNQTIADEPDLFLLVGHMPVSRDNWPYVHDAIRAVHPHTPIVIFGGHTHIRDCTQLDSRSMSLESGRFMETLGWMSMDFDKPQHTGYGHKTTTNTSEPIKFSRRYLDTNRNTYEYHTSPFFFDTPSGLAVSKGLTKLANEYNVSYVWGTAPQDYYLSRVPYTSNSSVLNLFTTEVMPVALAIVNPNRSSIPSTAIANSGSQRFDLLAGPFTINDNFIVSPFDDTFLFITVPFSLGSKVLAALNTAGASNKKRDADSKVSKRFLGGAREETAEEYARGVVDGRYNSWMKDQWERRDQYLHARSLATGYAANATLTLGYVTADSCPGIGDDTLHTPIPYYRSPDYIGSPIPTGVADDTPFDVIFLDFFEGDILTALNGLQTGKTYTTSDVALYGPGLHTNNIFETFAEAKWN